MTSTASGWSAKPAAQRGLGRAHARVHDAVEPRPRLGVREHQRARARRGRARRRASSTPAPNASAISASAWLPGAVTSRATASRSSVRQPRAGEPAQHVRLAARDAAGQADAQHGSPQRRLGGRPHRVRHQHRDRQRAHAARHRRERPGHRRHLRRVHVADERVAAPLELGEALGREQLAREQPGR